MSAETFEIEYLGLPAGSAMFRQSDDGFAFLWTRPDGEVICRSDYGTPEACANGLTAAVAAHYGAVQ